MSVNITGDCHGDFNRFATKNFPQLKGMEAIYIIQRQGYLVTAPPTS